MKYILTTPQTVGDFDNPILIDAVELASLSLNFSPDRVTAGTVILSAVLVHRASGYKFTVTYEDASAAAFWANLDGANNAVSQSIFSKLMADGKLPAGVITAKASTP